MLILFSNKPFSNKSMYFFKQKNAIAHLIDYIMVLPYFYMHQETKKLCDLFYCNICFIAVIETESTISARYACNLWKIYQATMEITFGRLLQKVTLGPEDSNLYYLPLGLLCEITDYLN